MAGTAPVFFDSAAAFGAWLDAHHDQEDEVLVGYWKKGTDQPTLTWPDSVDEALRFGWIDGVRRRVDDARYTIRFTPRRPGSHWSRVNVAKAEALIAAGRMEPAGLAAFAERDPDNTARASFERTFRLEAGLQEILDADKGSAFFRRQSESVRNRTIASIMAAKRPETRLRRLEGMLDKARRQERWW